jgi:hypothetical protein
VGGSYRRRAGPDPIDPGDEPPLSVDGRNAALIDRRRVSARWYVGTILTGLCGAALMGGAVYAALDGEAYFAAVPERLEALRGGTAAAERSSGSVRKTDKLQLVTETHTARQVVRVSTTTRVGEREVVRMRPYVRIATNLSLSTSELSASLPAFNAARLLSSSGPSGPQPADEAPGIDEAEISFVMRDLAPALPRTKLAGLLPVGEIMARVREVAGPVPGAPPRAVASHDPKTRLAYAAEGDLDAYFAGFESRVVPENITLLPKTAGQVTGGGMWSDRLVVARRGDTIAIMMRELGSTADEAKAIAAALGPRGNGALKEGQKLRVLVTPSGAGQRSRPMRVVVVGDNNAPEAVVALSDAGKYVAVDAPGSAKTASAPKPCRSPRVRKRRIPARSGSIRASTRRRCANRCRGR